MQFKFLSALCGAVLAVLALQPAQAAIITQNFSGTVTTAVAGNPFGLNLGDSLAGSVTYDSDLLDATDSGILDPSVDPSFALTMAIGAFVFNETDDNSYPSYPEVTIAGGQIVGLDFVVNFDLNQITYAFVVARDDFQFKDPRTLVAGVFNFNQVQIPEPGTLVLFGLGLAGAALLRRRSA